MPIDSDVSSTNRDRSSSISAGSNIEGSFVTAPSADTSSDSDASNYSATDKLDFDSAYSSLGNTLDDLQDDDGVNQSSIFDPAFDYGNALTPRQTAVSEAIANADGEFALTTLSNNETVAIDLSRLSSDELSEYAQLRFKEQELAVAAIELNQARQDAIPSYRQGSAWAFAQAEAELARSKREDFEIEHNLVDHAAVRREALHTVLDVAGMTPVVGTAADFLNAGIYVSEFDLTNAAISIGGIIAGGQVITGARLADKVVDAATSIDGTVERSVKLTDGTTVHMAKHADGTATNIVERADGSVVVTHVEKVNGRYPINSGYAGRTHPTGVQFKENGFPDFTPFAMKNVEIPNLTGNIRVDEKQANKIAGFIRTPEGYTWHHVEDGKIMQLVPEEIHKATRHTGGAAVIKSRGM